MKRVKKLVSDRLQKRREPETLGKEKVPRITNTTVAEYREEVLSGARKLIYPLQHPKKYIIYFTTTLIIVSIVAFFSYVTLALYRYRSTSTFMYRVTQVIPFPVARTGSTFIAYENYLFELRHYIFYYENQQKLDFETEEGRQQLDEFRRRALDKVINDTYVKQIADAEGIAVSEQEIDEQIAIVRRQDRLGNSDQILDDVLRDFWDWSIIDFRRSLAQQLLAQKVAAHLDTDTTASAIEALAELEAGSEFEEVAKKYSEDPATAENGGAFGFEITRTSRDVSAQTVDALFSLEPGEVSDIVNIGYALQILQSIEREGDTVRGAHILFTFEDINTYVNEAKEEEPAMMYLSLPEQVPVEASEPASTE
jgi:hypothetical protein